MATKERDAVLWDVLVSDFGPKRIQKGAWKEIWPANMIFGTCLRMELLSRDGRSALVAEDGTETKCEITHSDLQNVKAKLGAALPAGDYVLKVYTRSGLGVEFGVKCVSRKVEVK